VALSAGALVGSVLGLIAGYRGGWLDILIMRAADAALGFPTVLVAMIVVTILGAGIENIILAVVLTVWARFARMIRGDVLYIRELDFVTFAKIAGVSTPIIILRHVFPNTINTLMVVTSLLVGQVILRRPLLASWDWGCPPASRPGALWCQKGRTKSLMSGGCPSFRGWRLPL
jgi:peptide/nickel transport system permease protein